MIERRRQVHHLTGRNLPVIHHRTLNNPVDADDGDLGVVDHRGGGDAAKRAQAGDRDRRTGQFFACCLSGTGSLAETLDFGGGLPWIERLGMAHDRHCQPRRSLRRDADMHRIVTVQHTGLVVVTRVDLGMINNRIDHCPHEERQQGEVAALGAGLIEVGA